MSGACEECEGQPNKATIMCPECGQKLCDECDSWLHSKGKLARHKRNQLVEEKSPEQIKREASWLKCTLCVCGEFFKEYIPSAENPNVCGKCHHALAAHDNMDKRGGAGPQRAQALKPMVRKDREEEAWKPTKKAAASRGPAAGEAQAQKNPQMRGVSNQDVLRKQAQNSKNPAGILKGDKITVSLSVTKPALGWGRVRHGDVGTVQWTNGTICHVQFPNRKLWKGTLAEMDLVPNEVPLFSSAPGAVSPLGVGPGADKQKKKEEATKAAAPSGKKTPWKAVQTPEGEEYYWNEETNETRWEKPDELKEAEQPAAKAGGIKLEAGSAVAVVAGGEDPGVVKTPWKAVQTAEGEEYYWNHETNETRWEKPEELIAAERAAIASAKKEGEGAAMEDTDTPSGEGEGAVVAATKRSSAAAEASAAMKARAKAREERARAREEAEKAKAELERTKKQLEQEKAKAAAEAAKKAEEEAAAAAAKEIEKAKAEAAKLRAEMEKHKREAEEARKAAERAKEEAAAEAMRKAQQKADEELRQAKAEAERLKREAEEAKKEARRATMLAAEAASSRKTKSKKHIIHEEDDDAPPPPPPPGMDDPDPEPAPGLPPPPPGAGGADDMSGSRRGGRPQLKRPPSMKGGMGSLGAMAAAAGGSRPSAGGAGSRLSPGGGSMGSRISPRESAGSPVGGRPRKDSFPPKGMSMGSRPSYGMGSRPGARPSTGAGRTPPGPPVGQAPGPPLSSSLRGSRPAMINPGAAARLSKGVAGGGSRPMGGSRPTQGAPQFKLPEPAAALSPPPPPPDEDNAPEIAQDTCEDCEEEPAVIWCEECEQKMCKDCDSNFHRRGNRKKHMREPLKPSRGAARRAAPAPVTVPDPDPPSFQKPKVMDDDLPPGWEEPELPPPPPGM